MLVSQYRRIGLRGLLSLAMAIALSLGGCGDRIETNLPPERPSFSTTAVKLAEVAPPQVLQQLRSELEIYQPQVTIVSPKANEVLLETSVSVRLQVQDFPLFKDSDLEIGPHLHLILDNQPYRAIYNTDEPVIFENLEPGTHTLRAFAVYPWNESFKNGTAFAQTTFHAIAPTENKAPDSSQPLLTYNAPQGNYGAEPILLDFYLSNAPLHLVAREDSEDDIQDWRIRVTANGQSFLADTWQSLYLTGFQPGQNWVKLELLDEEGEIIDNAFNSTVRLITYEPDGQDSLSKLMRGELAIADAKGMVDPNYVKPVPPVEEVPLPEEPRVEEIPIPEVEEIPEEVIPAPPTLEEPSFEETPVPEVEEIPTEEISPSPVESIPPEEEIPAVPVLEEPSADETPIPEVEEIPAEEEIPAPPTLEEPRIEEVPPSPVEIIPPEEEIPAAPVLEEPNIEEIPIPEVAEEEISAAPVLEEPSIEETPIPEVEEIPIEEVPPSPVEIIPPEEETPAAPVLEESSAEETPTPEVEEIPTEEEIPATPVLEEPSIEEIPTEEVPPSPVKSIPAEPKKQTESRWDRLRHLFQR